MPDFMGPEMDVPVSVPIEDFDATYVGYYTADRLGDRGGTLPPLLAADVEITPETIDLIRHNAHKLGEEGQPLTMIRVKRVHKAKTPDTREILSSGHRRLVFRGIAATMDDVKDQFQSVIDKPDEVIRKSSEETIESLRKVKVTIDPDMRRNLELAIQRILAGKDEATLFACLDEYSHEYHDHRLHVFMVGLKLIAKHFNIKPDRVANTKRAMNYAIGLMYHDIGMLLVPDQVLEKSYRIPREDVYHIGKVFKERKIPIKYLRTILAVNDPLQTYMPLEEHRLVKEIDAMRFLVSEGILTDAQYFAIRQFPDWSCYSLEERAFMERHPLWGYEIVNTSDFRSAQSLDIIQHHHERLDGSGYPKAISHVTMEAQIAAAADIFDGIVTERPHKRAKPYDVAFDTLDSMSSHEQNNLPQLNRVVYDLFCAVIEKYPTGSFVRVHGGQFDGCVGQVTRYTPGVHTMNKPEFVLFREKDGRRMAQPLRFRREHYDGSFSIRGLPFTSKDCDNYLRIA